MPKHLIYYFSGTGNSLWTALCLQKMLGDCDVVPMSTTAQCPDAVSSIGFVFPCYFSGAPRPVLEFIAGLDFSKQEGTYYYVVVTYGAMLGSVLGQTRAALSQRGITLNYAAPLKAFADYVVAYDMSDKVAEKTAQTKKDLQEIVPHILEQDSTDTKKPSALLMWYNRIFTKNLEKKDRNYQVRESCNGCGICMQVCPRQNILMVDGKPQWQHHCAQCVACIQWCPKRAIDYGEKTRKRGRYTHPEITSKMFIDYLTGVGPSNVR